VGRPRVLINALSLGLGGGRSYVRNLLRELARDPRGMEFTVLAAEEQLGADERSGIPLAAARLPGGPLSLRGLPRVAYEELALPLRARSFDLLYCVADLSPAIAWTPTVVALRNLNIYDRRFYDNARTRTLYRMVRLGLRRCRRIICPTRAAAEQIGAAVGISPEEIAVVPHGIAAAAFAQGTHPASGPRYVFVPAAIERQKNLGVAIEALSLVSDPGLELWIAGWDHTDPGHAVELRSSAARLGLENRVRFLGAVPYHEMLGYYRRAECLVLPSLMESFGHPLLEAMLAEVPIVAADIPAFREVAEGAALFFAPRESRQLARRIGELRSDRDATRARVARGREIAARFSWGRSVDALCQVLYESLAERPATALGRSATRS
jgi:glycosyltransferase involved in cell wall biosynthesis